MPRFSLPAEEDACNRKLRVMKALYKEPPLSASDVAQEIKVATVTIYRWMEDLDEAKAQKIIEAAESARKKKPE